MSNEATSGIDWTNDKAVVMAADDRATVMFGQGFFIKAHIFRMSGFCSTAEAAWSEARQDSRVVAFEQQFRPHRENLEDLMRDTVDAVGGDKPKCLAVCDDTLDCCAPDCPCAAPESAVPAKVGPVSLTVTLNFDLGDPLQKELFCQCLEMFREAGLTQAVPAIAASAPAQAEADAIKAQS